MTTNTPIQLRYPFTGQNVRVEVFDSKAAVFPEDWSFRQHDKQETDQLATERHAADERFKVGLRLLYRKRQAALRWEKTPVFHLWCAWQEVKQFVSEWWRDVR